MSAKALAIVLRLGMQELAGLLDACLDQRFGCGEIAEPNTLSICPNQFTVKFRERNLLFLEKDDERCHIQHEVQSLIDRVKKHGCPTCHWLFTIVLYQRLDNDESVEPLKG